MDNLFGLPAHPLVVHAAVVLVPLAAIGTIVIAVWPRSRRSVGWIVVGLALVGFVAAFLSQESGESLEERVRKSQLVHDHAELGDTGTVVAFGVVVMSGAVMGLDLVRRRGMLGGASTGEPGWLRPAGTAVSALAVVVSLGATYQIIRIGHTGAQATWHDTPAEEGGGEHEGMSAPPGS